MMHKNQKGSRANIQDYRSNEDSVMTELDEMVNEAVITYLSAWLRLL